MPTRSKSDTTAWDAVLRRVKQMGGYTLAVGIVNDRPHEGSNLTIAEVGAIHELGAPSIGLEARPWLGFTMNRKKRELAAMAGKGMKAVLAGTSTAIQVLSQMGTFAATATKASIRQRLIRQELAESTKKRRAAKGDADPAALLDSEQLVDAVGFKIDKTR